MKAARSIFALAFVTLPAIAVLYIKVLPYHFSEQNNIRDLSGKYDKTDVKGFFHDQDTIPTQPGSFRTSANVLGSSDSDKRIEIDLANQRLYAYEGDKKVYDFLISSGKWGKTPTGEFKIWIKLRYTKMSGGSKELHTYYYLPNVPYVMYFSNSEIPAWRGFGIHGTYWHDNFGHPMSHGCINMKTEEAEKIFYWANPKLGDKQSISATKDNPGTKIVIYGEAPNE
ncbi:hypothetical protein A2982_03055 [candidate division WWE3 bacterium RIFCSPLOWO2_01_FULL_39_13]|uniref:L,D-TPase catalytic domain-containing protein n=1 Tax=candidate division WWE3 bacterium RIFCSPLOWO2_01_FULL_39_13 TaxID=1802624 RepID=A0A1F4V1V1_UNCKA|nr:MAG: hypothetical protein A2982_03055 [candidate division WWE3 bacterium RIFCSPLOWO2_01_FULL_39_13]